MTSTEDKQNKEDKVDSIEEESLNFADLKKKFQEVEEEEKENVITRKRSRTKSNAVSSKKHESHFEYNEDAEWCVIAAKCDYQKMARRLIDNPMLSRAKDPMSGYTALHWACKVGNLDAVKMLAGTYKASIDAKTHGGYTPSHLAAMFDNRDVYDILDAQYGADFNIRDYHGRRPFSYLTQTATTPIKRANSVERNEVPQILTVIKRDPSGRFVVQNEDEEKKDEKESWGSYFKTGFTSLRRSFRYSRPSEPGIKEENIEPVKVTVDIFEAKAKEEASTSPMSLDVPDLNSPVQSETPDNTNVSEPEKRKTLLDLIIRSKEPDHIPTAGTQTGRTGRNTAEKLSSLRIEKDNQWNEIDLNSDSETVTIPVPQFSNVKLARAPNSRKQQAEEEGASISRFFPSQESVDLTGGVLKKDKTIDIPEVPNITVINEMGPPTHQRVADPFLQGRVEYIPEGTADAVPDRVDYVPGHEPELKPSSSDEDDEQDPKTRSEGSGDENLDQVPSGAKAEDSGQASTESVDEDADRDKVQTESVTDDSPQVSISSQVRLWNKRAAANEGDKEASQQPSTRRRTSVYPKGLSGVVVSHDKSWAVEAAKGDYLTLMKKLQANPDLVHHKDMISGYTALHWACKHGNSDLVKMIAGTYKAPVNEKSYGGYTPLHIAAINEHFSIYDILIQAYHADNNVRDNRGKRPSQYLTLTTTGDVSENIQTQQTEKKKLLRRRSSFLNDDLTEFNVDDVKPMHVVNVTLRSKRKENWWKRRFSVRSGSKEKNSVKSIPLQKEEDKKDDEADDEEEVILRRSFFRSGFHSLRESFRQSKSSQSSEQDIDEEKLGAVKEAVNFFETKAKEEAPMLPVPKTRSDSKVSQISLQADTNNEKEVIEAESMSECVHETDKHSSESETDKSSIPTQEAIDQVVSVISENTTEFSDLPRTNVINGTSEIDRFLPKLEVDQQLADEICNIADSVSPNTAVIDDTSALNGQQTSGTEKCASGRCVPSQETVDQIVCIERGITIDIQNLPNENNTNDEMHEAEADYAQRYLHDTILEQSEEHIPENLELNCHNCVNDSAYKTDSSEDDDDDDSVWI